MAGKVKKKEIERRRRNRKNTAKSKKREIRNNAVENSLKKVVKDLKEAIEKKDSRENIIKINNKIHSVFDKAKNKKVIKKNKCNRKKRKIDIMVNKYLSSKKDDVSSKKDDVKKETEKNKEVSQ